MDNGSLVFSFFLIFTGAAALASIALYTRQPLLVAYIVLGAILGPYGLKLVSDTKLLSDISHIGIIFLLFLLGLDMQPGHLAHMLKKTALIGLVSSLAFAASGYVIALAFGFTQQECLIIGAAMMFSSTIIGIKLLPTTVLHHKHTGELVVSILLLQDLVAIVVLLFLYGGEKEASGSALLLTLLALPALVILAFVLVKYVLLRLMQKFDRFHEYLFLLALGWCLGLAELANLLGLSAEIGAFIAGVSVATSPIALYIATSLKPLRDFFLILFFFSVGASFNLGLLADVIVPACLLSLFALTLKPAIFRSLMQYLKEKKSTAWEVGFRLGQVSEFSILIAYIAANSGLIGTKASHVIQATAIITFLLSSYIVVFNFKSPIAVSDRLRRD
ncbi:cation:proton antiporter [Spartinivicinus poritis]|uniref:Cation:proton antiporter n=1 Tax=Spartinivicinus poritis TaxID=2994640 RepID=A0ABT5U4C6_9GAMM|nr:cation:proton antiporter [Spartinivicinus sp. A2-2]MDE1461070.1 cation:proton antiporter [Spartinivicinus sp. A2-2]